MLAFRVREGKGNILCLCRSCQQKHNSCGVFALPLVFVLEVCTTASNDLSS